MSPSFVYFYESQQPSEKDANVKLKQLQYLLVKALPVLRDIYAEQNRELEVESAIRGMFSSLVLSSHFFFVYISQRNLFYSSRSPCDRI